MNLTNILQPIADIRSVTIIGCGAIGSNLAVQLTRLGIPKLILWDDDIVSPHNITNQAYNDVDIGTSKVTALTTILKAINPEVEVVEHIEKFEAQQIRYETHLFLAVDNIDTRKKIIQSLSINKNVKSICDFRLALTSAQHYAVKWNADGYKWLLDTMDFTHEQAKSNIPQSPCGTNMSVLPTVLAIVAFGVENWIKLVRSEGEPRKLLMLDTATCQIVII